jgi:Kef-type K+ transport system membrane component KefB
MMNSLFLQLAVRLGQAALVGELVSGIALGLVVHGFAGSFPILSELTANEVFLAVTDLAVFFLMLLAGIELHPRKLMQGSGSSLAVAVGGMLVPLGLGCALAWWFLPASPQRIAQVLFVGVALAVTAVPVSIRVLMDLDLLESRVGRTIVSAAIFDDVLSLLLLAALTAAIQTGAWPSGAELAALGGRIALFFLLTVGIGGWLVPRAAPAVRRLIGEESELSALLILALGFAVLGEALDMHFILGAFLAGLFFTRNVATPEIYDDVRTKLSGLTTGFLAPVFFASIGLHLDLAAVTTVPVFLGLFLAAAFLGKLLGAGGVARLRGLGWRDSVAVGVGMSGRGMVELVIADVALRAGLFDVPDPPPPIVAGLFSAVVLMAVITTLATPLALRRLLARS